MSALLFNYQEGRNGHLIAYQIRNTQLYQSLAILIILLFVFLTPAAFGAQSDENEVAKEVQSMLDKARPQATGCAAAGYDGCCTGDNCKTESGCYCDVKCYYFHNCCDDITTIGCYRKHTIQHTAWLDLKQ